VTANTFKILVFSFFVLSICSCKDSNGKSIFEPNRVEPPKVQDRDKSLYKENVGRDLWQKPELVINKLGNIEGKVIADIGAGTGYFVVRLSYRKAKVIAIEIDPIMIDYIDSFKEILPPEVQENISTRLARTDNPMLKDKEIDVALIINTISYMDQLEAYLTTLKKGIKPNGSIMILDYKNKMIDIQAPPLEDRVSIGKIQTYLTNAGYKNIVADDTSLDYQYIITADVE